MKKRLLEKYWQGDTSAEEEDWLRKNTSLIDDDTDPAESAFFQQLQQFSELEMPADFGEQLMETIDRKEQGRKRIALFRKVRRIAAAVLVLVTLSVATYTLMQPNNDPILAEEEDPEKAYEIAKQSLLLIASKMEAGASFTFELDKFDEVHSKLRQESTSNKEVQPAVHNPTIKHQ
ncbi:MAG: hypothetical protein AAF990_00815 [Bacteroidota bacterium]